MDLEQAKVIVLANTKGTASKKKDLLAVAHALEFIKSNPEYRTNRRVGDYVGLSGEVVREFLTLLTFPEELQQLFAANELGLEQGRRLWQLKQRRPDALVEAAGVVVDMTAMDARQLVVYLLEHPDMPVEEAKRRVLESKTIHQNEYHVVAIISQDDFRSLSQAARQRRVSVDTLVTKIVGEWLKGFGDE